MYLVLLNHTFLTIYSFSGETWVLCNSNRFYVFEVEVGNTSLCPLQSVFCRGKYL
jgi:hypothetical protein